MQTATTSSNITKYVSPGQFKGQTIYIAALDDAASLDCDHEIEVMHHLDAEGRHWCPTGFVWCPKCGATGEEPEPHSCQRWDQ